MKYNEVLDKLHHWCSSCPKAYDFTCSGRDAKKCNEQKEAFLRSVRHEPDRHEISPQHLADS